MTYGYTHMRTHASTQTETKAKTKSVKGKVLEVQSYIAIHFWVNGLCRSGTPPELNK